MFSNTERILTYPISMLMSIDRKKTCEAIAKKLRKSGDQMLRLLKEPITSKDGLIELAKVLFKGREIFFITDDTLICKIHSELIEGTGDNFDASNKKTYRSLCSVVAMLTDGKIAIPITQAFWTPKEFAKEAYKKKHELAQDLLMQIYDCIDIAMVLADGLYAKSEMLQWLIDKNIFFEMRFHSNRVIEFDGRKQVLREVPELQLKKSKFRRTITAIWKGMKLYFTAIKRWSKKREYHITYQVSNRRAPARDHEKFYRYRWNIEKFFRTAKQSLGFNDCQARSLTAQGNHVTYIFIAYALLQYERVNKKLKSPEAALKRLKSKSFDELLERLNPVGQIFGVSYA